MNKEKGECRLSYKFIKSVAMSNIHQQLKVLHWFYMKHRFKKDYEKGFIEIKSFRKEAQSVGMKIQNFMKVLRVLEGYGLFEIVIKSDDTACNQIRLHSVIKSDDTTVIKSDDSVSSKVMTENLVDTTNINPSQASKHSFKQLEDKALSKATTKPTEKRFDEKLREFAMNEQKELDMVMEIINKTCLKEMPSTHFKECIKKKGFKLIYDISILIYILHAKNKIKSFKQANDWFSSAMKFPERWTDDSSNKMQIEGYKIELKNKKQEPTIEDMETKSARQRCFDNLVHAKRAIEELESAISQTPIEVHNKVKQEMLSLKNSGNGDGAKLNESEGTPLCFEDLKILGECKEAVKDKTLNLQIYEKYERNIKRSFRNIEQTYRLIWRVHNEQLQA